LLARGGTASLLPAFDRNGTTVKKNSRDEGFTKKARPVFPTISEHSPEVTNFLVPMRRCAHSANLETLVFKKFQQAIEPGSGPGAPPREPCGCLWRSVVAGSTILCTPIRVSEGKALKLIPFSAHGKSTSPWCWTRQTRRHRDYMILQPTHFQNPDWLPMSRDRR